MLTTSLHSPALILYRSRIARNIQRVLDAAGDRWRPHVKTVKCRAVIDELVRHGISKFKCATPREAAILCEVGGDILVAFPHVGPNLEKLERLQEANPHVRLSVLVEDHVETWLDVFVDVNPGMDRSGIPLDETERILDVMEGAGTRFRGLHMYDGHATKLGETRARREPHLFAIYDKLLASFGGIQGEIVTAGTPALLSSLAHPGLRKCEHTVSPGTVVLADMRTAQQVPELDLEYAAVVFTRCVSRPTSDIVTFDAGVKAVAADAGHPMCFVVDRPDLHPLTPSEEHLPVRCTSTIPQRGESFYLVPRHVCPTVNLAETAILMDDDGSYSVVEIEARAHDLLLSGLDET